MNNIIISTSKIKVCELYYELTDFCGYDRSWSDSLWSQVVINNELYEEFVYYLENHTFKDSLCVCGYSLSDLYVFQMNKYNLIREIGKNPVECNKERMVLNSFEMMCQLINDPDTIVKRIEEGKGEDKL